MDIGKRIKMKQTKVNVKLKWLENNGEYFTIKGPYMVIVRGKHYEILDHKINHFWMEDDIPGHLVYQAKARSNKDAFQRASNKLMKLID